MDVLLSKQPFAMKTIWKEALCLWQNERNSNIMLNRFISAYVHKNQDDDAYVWFWFGSIFRIMAIDKIAATTYYTDVNTW